MADDGELRFDPLTRTWVNIVGHRQHRPNLPSSQCPFCPGGLEAPEPYRVRWFPNRWPAFAPGAPIDPAAAEAAGVRTLPARGAAEVVLYTPDHTGSFAALPHDQVRAVVDMWAERTAALMERPEIEYVLIFENRGAEVGATIHHPHGQIYAYPMVPPEPAREAAVARDHGCAVCAEIASERAEAVRLVHDEQAWTAWVPFASGQPYGLRLATTEHTGRLDQLDGPGRDGLAHALATLVGRYDALWAGTPGAAERFPYLMWIHQSAKHDAGDYHLHVHFAPPQRAPGLMRFVASGELGGGLLSNPVVPEEAAAALRAAQPARLEQ